MPGRGLCGVLLLVSLAATSVDAAIQFVAMFPKCAQYAGRLDYAAENVLLIVKQDDSLPMDLIKMGFPTENMPTVRLSAPPKLENIQRGLVYVNHTHIQKQEKKLIDFSRYQSMSAAGAACSPPLSI